jgi:hypothetical protein
MLTQSEIEQKYAEFLGALSSDLATLQAFVHTTENYIAIAINSWLSDAFTVGLLFRPPGEILDMSEHRRLVDAVLKKRISDDPNFLEMCSQLAMSLVPLCEAAASLEDHVKLNLQAADRLLRRRDKNVDTQLKALLFSNSSKPPALNLATERTLLIAESLTRMRTAIEDVYERAVTLSAQDLDDLKATPSIARLAYCLKLPSTCANSPAISVTNLQ